MTDKLETLLRENRPAASGEAPALLLPFRQTAPSWAWSAGGALAAACLVLVLWQGRERRQLERIQLAQELEWESLVEDTELEEGEELAVMLENAE